MTLYPQVKISPTVALIVCSTLLLMSFDLTYTWFAPIKSEGQSVDWYSSFGLRGGTMGLLSSDFAEKGFSVGLHMPVFFPLPCYAIGGPEGGGIGVAVWFLVAITSLAVFMGRLVYRTLHMNRPSPNLSELSGRESRAPSRRDGSL